MAEETKMASISRLSDDKIVITFPEGSAIRVFRSVPLDALLKVLSPEPDKGSGVKYSLNVDLWDCTHV